ncbi:hypothetical protein NUW58_g4219 [Xylaria curta]|uniref:Uncharacterized protein n=1 Tax=Xylaria curta TaxID=42375 RepID=A0ACC1P7D3_9PEZI|nr:hypothetical protein NUW58_g4219 [Xylaria curta]
MSERLRDFSTKVSLEKHRVDVHNLCTKCQLMFQTPSWLATMTSRPQKYVQKPAAIEGASQPAGLLTHGPSTSSPPPRIANPCCRVQVRTTNTSRTYREPTTTLFISKQSQPSALAARAAGKPKPPPPKPKPSRLAGAAAVETVTALYDYSAQSEGHLSFRAGDIIEIVNRTQNDNEWWTGKINGKQGQFSATLQVNALGLTLLHPRGSEPDSRPLPTVNIVFVHGLRGHPRKTWEYPAPAQQDVWGTNDAGPGTVSAKKSRLFGKLKQKIFKPSIPSGLGLQAAGSSGSENSNETIYWPADLLPSVVPRAKIWTYGYNADVHVGFFQANNKNSILEHGNDFMMKVERALRDELVLPIIFVAHSLGGLVVKVAINDMQSSITDRYKQFSRRIRAVVFCGSPHRGSDAVAWGKLASNLFAMALMDANSRLLSDLQVDSRILSLIQANFLKALHREPLRIHSFQEGRALTGVKGLNDKVVDDFSSKLGWAPETFETIDADHREMVKRPGVQDISDILKDFEQDVVKAALNIEAQVEHEKLQSVTEDPVTNDKRSDLLRRLYILPYEDRKDRNPERADGTCQWFTNHQHFQNWQESKTSNLLWVSADPGCGKSVLAKYLADDVLSPTNSRITCYFFFKDDFADQRSPEYALRCILRQIFIQNPALLSNTILGLFEQGGETLLNSFRGLWPYIQIRKEFQILENRQPTIHLSGDNEVEVDNISKEIDIFIEDQVGILGEKLQLQPAEQQLLQYELTRVPNRTYLWVNLMFGVIEDTISVTEDGLREVIRTLPKTVDAAYDRILCRSRDQEKAKRLLHIVVAASEPLSVGQMQLALAIKEHHRSYADLKLGPEDRFRRTVRDICGLFVTIMDSKIYLLHQTAKEFLVQQNSMDIISVPNLQWKFSLRPEESHRIIAEICIWYLLFDEFKSSSPLGDIDYQYLSNHIFVCYSAENWVFHFKRAQVENDDPKQHLVLRLFDVERIKIWFDILKWGVFQFALHPSGSDPLILASYLGIESVVKLLLEGAAEVHVEDEEGRTPLFWAACSGNKVVLLALLRNGAYSEAKGGETLLHGAILGGHKEIVQLLLEGGADIKAKDAIGRTPLHIAIEEWATYEEGEVTVQLLLENGADVGAKDVDGLTPLHRAVAKKDEAIVQLLLENGADVEAKDVDGSTPLHTAGDEWGYSATGEDLEAILWAERLGQATIKLIQLLLRNSADPEAKDDDGWTALGFAATHEDERCVQLLLENGADIEAKDNYGCTALCLAVMDKRYRTVQLFLENGADIEAKNNDGWTILHHLASHSKEIAIPQLLEKGADVKAENNFGATALHLAAFHDNERLILLLLEKGADIGAKDDLGNTALHIAALNGHEVVVQLLLEKGADIEAKNKFGDRALLAAAEEGLGNTALHAATEKGHEVVVQLILLECSDLINEKNDWGNTALHSAVAHIQEDSVWEDSTGENGHC